MGTELELRCEVGRGQFSDEYAVAGKTFDGTGYSLFVPREFVDPDRPVETADKASGWIRVIELAREGSLVLVRLPRETMGNGATITVDARELKAATAHQGA